MVNTKRGRRGDTRVSYDGDVNVSTLSRHLKTLNSDEFVQIYNLAYANGTNFDPLGGTWTPPVALNHASLPKLFAATNTPPYNTHSHNHPSNPASPHDHFTNTQPT